MDIRSQLMPLKSELIGLCENLSAAGVDVAEWRRTAGAKSEWSNHKTLVEHANFAPFDKSAKALGDFIQAHLPAALDLEDYAFRPMRMGGQVRWSSKGGSGRDGFTCEVHGRVDLVHKIAAILTWAQLSSSAPKQADRKKLKRLGLDHHEKLAYSFRSHSDDIASTGATPTLARARLLITSRASSLCRPLVGTSASQAFDSGLRGAEAMMDRSTQWTTIPTLWDALCRTSSVKSLAPKPLRAGRWKFLHSPSDSETVEAALATLLGIASGARIPKSEGDLYIVRPSEEDMAIVRAWCPRTAALRHGVNLLCREKIPLHLDQWEILPAGADQSAPVHLAYRGHCAQEAISA